MIIHSDISVINFQFTHQKTQCIGLISLIQKVISIFTKFLFCKTIAKKEKLTNITVPIDKSNQETIAKDSAFSESRSTLDTSFTVINNPSFQSEKCPEQKKEKIKKKIADLYEQFKGNPDNSVKLLKNSIEANEATILYLNTDFTNHCLTKKRDQLLNQVSRDGNSHHFYKIQKNLQNFYNQCKGKNTSDEIFCYAQEFKEKCAQKIIIFEEVMNRLPS